MSMSRRIRYTTWLFTSLKKGVRERLRYDMEKEIIPDEEQENLQRKSRSSDHGLQHGLAKNGRKAAAKSAPSRGKDSQKSSGSKSKVKKAKVLKRPAAKWSHLSPLLFMSRFMAAATTKAVQSWVSQSLASLRWTVRIGNKFSKSSFCQWLRRTNGSDKLVPVAIVAGHHLGRRSTQ